MHYASIRPNVSCPQVTLKTDKLLEIFNGLVVTFTKTKHINENRHGIRYVLDMVFLTKAATAFYCSQLYLSDVFRGYRKRTVV